MAEFPAPCTPPALLLSLDQHHGHKGATLSTTDAWEIAMAWRGSLQDRVRLVTGREGAVASLLDSYAWVRFKISLRCHESIFTARAAAMTWATLACCPGYGGHENPVFWKCVFSALATKMHESGGYSKYRHARDVQSVNDSIGFFDQPGHVFPRFMLDANALEYGEQACAGVRLFCGIDGEQLQPETATKLQLLRARLEPFLDGERTRRHIQVSLDNIQCFKFSGPPSAKEEDEDDEDSLGPDPDPVGPPLLKLLTEVNNSVLSDTEGPFQFRFRIHEIDFQSKLMIKSDEDIALLYKMMKLQSIEIRCFEWSVSCQGYLSGTGAAMLVGSLLALPGHATQSKTTTIQLSAWNNPEFVAVVSALPFATSMHSIQFSTECHEKEFDTHDLPWLAYAMFHPHASSSSWRSLQLERVEISEKSVAVMRAMARGNNLAALLDDTTAPSDWDAYYRVKLSGLAAIKRKPRAGARRLIPDGRPHGLFSEWVDVCGVSSLDTSTWSEWVRVIVPMYGLGWVQSTDVTSVEAHPPSRSSLTALILQRRDTFPRKDPEMVVQFTEPLVHSLQYLDVSSYCKWEPIGTLRQLLVQCQSLRVLDAIHAGELWSADLEEQDDEKGSQPMARLTELHLHIPYSDPHLCFQAPSLHHVQSSLSQLQVLRVQPSDNVTFTPSHDAIAFVLRHLHGLRVFHWQQSLRHLSDRHLPFQYTWTVERSAQLLNEIAFVDDRHLFVHGKLDRASMLAFLSVVVSSTTTTSTAGSPTTATQQEPSAVTRLDASALSIIFQFASSRTRRVIVIEPNRTEIVSDPDYRSFGCGAGVW